MDFVKKQGLQLKNKTGAEVDASQLSGKAVAFYFSAHWCPPCRGFTPLLKSFYEEAQKQGRKLEIIFVSGDRSEEEGNQYFTNDHGDWLMLASGESKDLSSKFGVRGIPHLVVVDSQGKEVSTDARGDVQKAMQGGASALKAVMDEWEKACGDWRDTAGTSLGGASAPAANDAAAMRAARLARLGGGGPAA